MSGNKEEKGKERRRSTLARSSERGAFFGLPLTQMRETKNDPLQGSMTADGNILDSFSQSCVILFSAPFLFFFF